MQTLPPMSRFIRLRSIVFTLLMALVFAGPAGAARLFTVDFNGNDINDLDGSDDVPINFTGSSGVVDGFIRAVNITNVGRAALSADITNYTDFSGSYPNGVGFGPGQFNFTIMDTLIFDVVLNAGSAPIDEIGVAVTSDPLFLDPTGAGFLDECDPGIPLGCRSNVPAPAQDPDAISLSPAFAPFFPGAALFGYDKGGLSGDNLEAGETSIRMFVSWEDLAGSPGTPLSRVNQTAVFMISSGTNEDFFTDIVPEPTTGTMLGLGLIGLAFGARKRA